MSQTLTISDELYKRLQTEANTQRLDSIKRLLEKTHRPGREPHRVASPRQNVFEQIETLQKRLSATLGTMPDSADLVREDRER